MTAFPVVSELLSAHLNILQKPTENLLQRLLVHEMIEKYLQFESSFTSCLIPQRSFLIKLTSLLFVLHLCPYFVCFRFLEYLCYNEKNPAPKARSSWFFIVSHTADNVIMFLIIRLCAYTVKQLSSKYFNACYQF